MSNDLTVVEQGALALAEEKLFALLESSLYPGAKLESIALVVNYCRAAKLDPLQKPVHIVPMSVKVGDKFVKRDVIMPGVNLYRTQASRSGGFAGVTEPNFGPMIEDNLQGVQITYPEWCKVTVYRIVNGEKCSFSATEYWVENYATASRDTIAPNAMWKKRPRGQLAKCTEAQALRKAFPDIAAAPTADEMEGKYIDVTPTDTPQLPGPEPVVALPACDQEKFDLNLAAGGKMIRAGKKTAADIIAKLSTLYTLTAEQKEVIEALPGPDAEREPGEEG